MWRFWCPSVRGLKSIKTFTRSSQKIVVLIKSDELLEYKFYLFSSFMQFSIMIWEEAAADDIATTLWGPIPCWESVMGPPPVKKVWNSLAIRLDLFSRAMKSMSITVLLSSLKSRKSNCIASLSNLIINNSPMRTGQYKTHGTGDSVWFHDIQTWYPRWVRLLVCDTTYINDVIFYQPSWLKTK